MVKMMMMMTQTEMTIGKKPSVETTTSHIYRCAVSLLQYLSQLAHLCSHLFIDGTSIYLAFEATTASIASFMHIC